MDNVHKVFLIDGTAFCYRAFYAIRNLSTSDGRPTNAVYGFAMMLQALTEKEHPDALAVAFDVGKPTFRHRKFEAYKIQRKPMPDPLISQLPLVKRLLEAYRVPVFEQEGYEGEDVLATIAKRIVRPGVEVYLVTGDKDALQLVNSHIKVYNPHKDGAVLDAAAVRSRYGVGPERMVDLMALMGDDIDNIPGVPGIGEKTAVHLLAEFGTVENLYRRLEEVTPLSRRETLQTVRDQVELSRELATIDSQVPLEVSLEALGVREPDWRALRALFREWEFKRLLTSIEAQAPPRAPGGVRLLPLSEPEELQQCLAQVRKHPMVAVACWLAPPAPTVEARILALAVDAQAAWVGQLDSTCLKSRPGIELREWLEDPSIKKVGHDLKGTVRRLAHLGIGLQGLAGDTMIAAYLLNPARTSQSLNDLADEHLGERLAPIPTGEDGLGAAMLNDAQPFGQAACAIVRLHERLTPLLREHGLEALYTELELPLIEVLAQMEMTGIALDVAYLEGLRASMDRKLTQLTDEIHQLAGGAFNINSPKQLAQVLFERLDLPIIKRTKTGASTDSDVLLQLSRRHPLPQRLMEYRELSKLVSTYVDALPKLVHPTTGRVHTTFNQTATATGRLSSSEPNVQNIPIKTELGRSIRRAFIPGLLGGVLVSADYSQIELRILAHLSGDAHLLEAFRLGRDIHVATAALVYGLPEGEVQPEQRSAMKAVNYGILYGMTSHGLSKELGIGFEEAQAFIDAYFQRYPKVRDYLDRQIAQARRDGYVQTLLGRRRYIPELNSADVVTRQFGERMAVNAPIQGTAADLIKKAMVQLAAELRQQRLESRMLLQVHDELLFECPAAERETLIALARRIMTGALTLSAPLSVTVKAGANWLEMTEVK